MDKVAPKEVKDLLRRQYTLLFGPAGNQEVDDMNNWLQSTDSSLYQQAGLARIFLAGVQRAASHSDGVNEGVSPALHIKSRPLPELSFFPLRIYGEGSEDEVVFVQDRVSPSALKYPPSRKGRGQGMVHKPKNRRAMS